MLHKLSKWNADCKSILPAQILHADVEKKSKERRRNLKNPDIRSPQTENQR